MRFLVTLVAAIALNVASLLPSAELQNGKLQIHFMDVRPGQRSPPDLSGRSS